MNGKLYVCATPIGNLEDISMRAIQTLKAVDLIAAEDTRHTLKLLNHFGIEKPMTSYFEHNRREKGEMLVQKMKSGKSVALVTDAGTPAISDPGEDIVALCIEEGIEVVPIPGPVAAICALVVSGLPTSRFAFEGFLPAKKWHKRQRLLELKNEKRTMIFYEAPHKLLGTLKDMLEVFGDRRISISRELTKIYEETLRTTLSEAVALYEKEEPKGEFVLVLEGASDEDLAMEERAKWEGMGIAEHVEFYLKQGMPEKDAIKAVAKDRGVLRREVYAQYKIIK